MFPVIDETHAADLSCWVDSATSGSEFPIQNLPLGVFSDASRSMRGGVAIGDMIIDLEGLVAAGQLEGEAEVAARAASTSCLNSFLALGAPPRAALRRQLSSLLSDPSRRAEVEPHLRESQACQLHLPNTIGDYSDFFAGIHHARSASRIMGGGGQLMPNYKHVPIGYHGRASTIRASGADVRRPRGQVLPSPREPTEFEPTYGPVGRLDFELELGIWIGEGNALGDPVRIHDAASHIAGFCLLNDWSARDVQGWEAQPLGPFLAKSFLTTISPWIVTPEAMAPFRAPQQPRPDGDPRPLDYLWDEEDQAKGAVNLDLEVFMTSALMRQRSLEPHRITRSAARHLYWTPAQLVAHQTSGGCNLSPGDLLGTGTISAPDDDGCGAMLEVTQGGARPLELPTGERRAFLEDGDEVIFKATARREGFVPIGFGPCRGVISPAR